VVVASSTHIPEVAAADEDTKKSSEGGVPNVVITCTADDDIEAASNALEMIESFKLPTADEVCASHVLLTFFCIINY